ncbi:vitronectin b [Trichomycterus rosablanca]|uniref:vitronectin b n=1 Tax=Trichomycterus rosablanca TaxID=2290929 RepID=UPI002F358375
MKFVVFLLLAVATAFAAEDSCDGRCQSGFDPTQKCQCDTMCKYYESCCVDFDTTCRTKIARGDTFEISEDLTLESNSTVNTNEYNNKDPAPDSNAEICSGQAFDAFLQMKNGSIYAFRGEYFFELDEKAVMPGYPKLIKDVWGIPGPIDAAFTRINCEGKSYIFKGNKYWRFDGHVLDPGYPRNISVGFDNIPDDVDAAIALPAVGHRKKEKAYFFTGSMYYQYEFKHQPSHEECNNMLKSSPSVMFTHYTDVYCDFDLNDLFNLIFRGTPGHHTGPGFINIDWQGIKPPVDAAMLGRLYVSDYREIPSSSSAPSVEKSRGRTRGGHRRKTKNKRVRVSRSTFWEDLGLDYEERYFGAQMRNKKKHHSRRPSLFDYIYDSMESDETQNIGQIKGTPMQNVYFFQKDKYYRVDLKSKRIDYADPPYPRSIAKYWLGCKEEDLAEKR